MLIQSILLDLENSPKDFGCLFASPMLPTINVDDKLIDSFILNNKFNNSKFFIDFNENLLKINSTKLKTKNDNKKYKDFIDIKSFGESWKELVFFYFFFIDCKKNKNELINVSFFFLIYAL